MNILTVIPCYNTKEKTFIRDCVKQLKISNPSFDILIIDSGSPDKSYFKEVENEKVEILDIHNKHYDIGALEIAIQQKPDYDFYFLIHDSLIVSRNLSGIIETHSALVFRYFLCHKKVGGFKHLHSRKDALKWIFQRISIKKGKREKISGFGFDNYEQMRFFETVCSKVGLTIPEYWLATFGPVFGISKEIATAMYNSGMFQFKPSNKNEQMAFERIIGLYLNSQFGANLGVIVGNHFECDLNSNGIEKIIAFRK